VAFDGWFLGQSGSGGSRSGKSAFLFEWAVGNPQGKPITLFVVLGLLSSLGDCQTITSIHSCRTGLN